jgi:hypothetical protein
MRHPEAGRDGRLLNRATELEVRFAAMGDAIPPAILDRVRQKLVHELVRSAIPVNHAMRVPVIIRELRTGRYNEFGRGIPDAVRDLIQPHDASR